MVDTPIDPADEETPVDDATTPNATGATSVDDKVFFEVYLLSFEAVRKISADIANRIAQWAEAQPTAPVLVLADRATLRGVPAVRLAGDQLATLKRALQALVDDLDGAAAERVAKPAKGLESFVPEILGSASAGIASLAGVLSWLRVDTSWYGRETDVGGALFPALEGRLADHGLAARSSWVGLASVAWERNGFFRALSEVLDLRYRLAHAIDTARRTPKSTQLDATGKQEPGAKKASEQDAVDIGDEDQDAGETEADKFSAATAAIAATDRWLEAAFKTDSEGKGQTPLLLTSAVLTGLLDEPDAFVLHAEVLKGGGHYRTRRHLFSILFGRGPLTYSGGAAVAFSLIDPRRSRTLLSDVLYHSSGDVTFLPPEGSVVSPSNLRSVGNRSLERARPGKAIAAAVAPAPKEATTLPNEEPFAKDADDDEAEASAETVKRVAPAEAGLEAISWRVAKSLLRLREQVNARAPNRNKLSDGTIGDANHASRSSDHNPWVPDGTNKGVVTAMDVTHDPAGGFDANAFAESLRNAKDTRVKYIIWNGQIANSSAVGAAKPFAWRPYTGKNKHDHHIHISVKSESAFYDNAADWEFSVRS